MKRFLLLLMACMLLIPAAWAEGENTLLRRAVELGRELDALAEDEESHRQFTHEEQVLAILRSYGTGSHDEPCEVRAIMLDELLPTLELEWGELPDAGKRQVQNMLPGVVMQSVVNSYGVHMVVASTIVQAETTFAAPEVDGCELWIMTYEDAAPIGVAWYAENGAVHMKAAFLPADITQLEELPVSTRVVAAARPALDVHAASLAEELQTLARNRQYLTLLGLSQEVLDTVMDYPAEENSTPRLVLCALTDDARDANVKLTQQIGYLGDSYLAAAGAMHASVIFADADASGTGLYLFLYEDSVPVIVQWQGENGAYHLGASFQPGEMPFACRSVEDANAWAESIGLSLNFQPLGVMLLP